MQTMVFTGRLAADPQISDDFGKAVFRLLEQRGTDNAGKARLVGVNCVSWSKGLNEKVIARGLAQGCEAVVIGAFIDTAYTARDGPERTAKRPSSSGNTARATTCAASTGSSQPSRTSSSTGSRVCP